ncbi:hypothetical protein PMAYCL1PPCAC_02217, partial [Pristionchus mayeri]
FQHSTMEESVAADTDLDDEDEEVPEIDDQMLETLANFLLVTHPYQDAHYIQGLPSFVRDDKEDFKRIVHGFLLASGLPWDIQDLKNKIKETYEFQDIREVDKFVDRHFKFQTFKEFMEKSEDIAIMEDSGLFLPFLDDSNRDIYEDAVQSVRNKGDKEKKKDDQIARKLYNPENVKGFYEGVNRLRLAIIKAMEIHMEKDFAFAKISVKDGTDKKVTGINVSHVQTEYHKLFGVPLTDDSQKICGRSTLMKAWSQGMPKCLVETVAMEHITEASLGVKQGMYIALKKAAHEYSVVEIEAAVDECRQKISEVNRRRNNREGREEGRRYGQYYNQRERDDQRKQTRELDNQKDTNAPQMASQTANSMHPAAFDEDEFDDSDDEANYSDDDEETNVKAMEEKKKKKAEKARASDVPSASTPTPLPSAVVPPSSSAPLHPEAAGRAVMHGGAPPPSRQSAPAKKEFVQIANQWEEEEEPEDSPPQSPPQPVAPTPAPAPAPAPPPQQKSSIFGPRPISFDNGQVAQPQPQLPPRQEEQPLPIQQQSVQQGQQGAAMQPQYGQQMQPGPPMPLMAQSAQGGQFPPQFAPPPGPHPNFQGDGMGGQMVPPQQVMQSGYWQGATPSQSQFELGVMPNQSQSYSHAAPSNMPMEMMQNQGPFSPNYYNNAPQQLIHPSPPPNHPGGYQGQNYGAQSPVININVAAPAPQGPEFPHAGSNYNNYPHPQAPGQVVLPQGYSGHPQGHQGAGFPQGAPQGYELPNQSAGYNVCSHGQFNPHGGGFPRGPPQAGYHAGDGGGGGYSGRSSPQPDPHYQNMSQFHRMHGETRGYEEGRGEVPRHEQLRPMPQHYVEEREPMQRESNRVRQNPPFENGFPRGREDEKRREVPRANQPARGGPSNGQGERREEGGFGRDLIGGGARFPRDNTGGGGHGLRRDDEYRRDDRGDGNRPVERNRRVETFGRPQGTSTPFNRTHEGNNVWTAFDRMDTARTRIRWLVICVLKNVRDENYVHGLYKRGINFEIVDVSTLADLVMMGCGDDMELYEATSRYQESPNPFLEFLKEMREDGLLRLYTETVRGEYTNEPQINTYAMDPYTQKPDHFRVLEG